MRTASYTDIGGRECNEDSVRIIRHGGAVCALVADGLGGHGHGDAASRAAAEAIAGAWQGEADEEALRALVRSANERVLALQGPLCSMKTTLVLLAVRENTAVWAHVGDSRLYCFIDGRLKAQTLDHSVAQMNVLLGEITPEEIRFHEDRSRVLRALGQEDELKIDTGRRELGPGRSAFLLCSDGFWEYVLEEEMERDLQAATDPEDWLRCMRKRLLERVRGENDNNTAAAVWAEN